MGDSTNTDKAPKISFWNGVKAEFKKISWPDRQALLKQSVAVACISIVLGVVITLLDTILQYGVKLLSM